MTSQKCLRAAHRGDGGDPRKADQAGGSIGTSNSTPLTANQDPIRAAVTRSRSHTGMASAMRRALERRGRA